MAEDKSTATGVESDAIQPPTGKILKESLSVLQVPRLAFRTPSLLLQAPRGTRQPVLMIPGLKAGDASNAPMRSFLRRKNFQVWGWGLGTNNGDVPGQLPNVVARAEELFERAEEDDLIAGIKVGAVVVSMPHMGKIKAIRLLEELGIDESKRLRALGSRQKASLLASF